jgi:hypothetical protein
MANINLLHLFFKTSKLVQRSISSSWQREPDNISRAFWTAETETQNLVNLRVETRHVADTLDKVEFINGVLHLLEDVEYFRENLPESLAQYRRNIKLGSCG